MKNNGALVGSLKSIVAASCALVASAEAGVSYLQTSYYGGYTGTVIAQGSSHYTYLTAISADLTNGDPLPPNHSDPFITFCLDVNNNLGSGWWKSGGFGDVALTSQSIPAQRQAGSLYRAANLYSTYASGVLGAFSNVSSAARTAARIEGAALQLAIWEVLYEPNANPNSTLAYNVLNEGSVNGGFRSTGVNSTVATRANQMLATASVANFNLDTTFWNAVTSASGTTSRSSQDLIGPFAPVPEPGTYFAAVLLGLPILLKGARQLRQRQ